MDVPTETDPPAATDNYLGIATPPRRPGVWSGLGIVALYFLLQASLSLLIGIAIGFGLALSAGFEAGLHHAKPAIGAAFALLKTNPDVRVVLTIMTIVAAAAVTMWVVHRIWPAQWPRADLPGFGFAPPSDRRACPVAVVAGFCLLLLGGLLTHFLAGRHPVHQDVTVMATEAALGMRLLLVPLVVVVAPCVEELVFRGVLLSGLARRMPVGLAIVISAGIFGCAHLPDFGFAWYPVPALVLLGLVLGWTRVRTRSLWPSITIHASNNFFAAIAWFVVAHHP